MTHQLPNLPYATNALEPHVDSQTMEIHHGKHHNTYVTNLNVALEAHPDLQDKTVEELLSNMDSIPTDIKTAVQNSAGGHANHTLFWKLMTPGGSKEPVGDLKSAIESKFGSFEDFKTLFTEAATKRFGSGWAWLVINSSNELEIYSTANQDSPLMQGHIPIVGLDVWEHAYYLKYQNRRPEYIENWWNVLNWDIAEANYKSALNK